MARIRPLLFTLAALAVAAMFARPGQAREGGAAGSHDQASSAVLFASNPAPLGFGDSCRDYASTNVPLPISDLSTVTSNLSVPDSLTISSVQVTLNISHPSDDNLDVFLRSSTGAEVELFTDVGGMGANFTNTTLGDAAVASIAAGSAPFTGSFRPEGSLNAFAGLTFAGPWQLRITDDSAANTGTLNAWSLRLCASLLNDEFSNAVDISGLPFTYAQYTEAATTAFDDPVVTCVGASATHSNSVWFRLQPSVGTVVEITTDGSSYDTVLAVFTGTAGALTQVACNDNGGAGLQSTLGPLIVAAGTAYYIEAVDFDVFPGGGSLLLTVTSNADGDTDGDGCTNGQELGPTPVQGGARDPFNFWDFFDTPGPGNLRDRAITAGDLARVVERFGSPGNKAVDPLTAPLPAPAYHPAFDRTPPGAEPNGIEQGPNGSITSQDIAIIVSQFGHTCV